MRLIDRWDFTEAHYDAQLLYANLATYVAQKAHGESKAQFDERLAFTKYLPIFSAVIDSIVGGVARRDHDITRIWAGIETEGFDELLKRDADTKGTAWSHLQLHKLTYALVFNEAWTLVDTTRTDSEATSKADSAARGDRPFLSLFAPTSLLDWREDDTGRMVEALLLEFADERVSLATTEDSDDAETRQFLHLQLDSWRRLQIREGENGKPKIFVVGSGMWDTPWLDRDGRQRLPLVKMRPRLRRYASYELAQLSNEILNINSELRYILRFGGLGQYLALAQEDEAFTDQVTEIKEGSRVIQEDPEHAGHSRFFGPDISIVNGMVTTLEAKVRQFWQAALFEFSDQSVERTAAEIKSDFASALGATLASLSEAADESENEELWLLAQAVGADLEGVDPSSDEAPNVKRPRDFTTEDAISVVIRMRDAVKGQNAPLKITPEIDALLTATAMDKLGLADDFEGGIKGVREAVLAEPEPEPPAPPVIEAPPAEIEPDEEDV